MSAIDGTELRFPIMRYDITAPFFEGRVEIEGFRLKPVRTPSMVSREDPQLKQGDFGLLDLNLGYLLPAVEAGWEMVALPVFVKRKPVYQFIFCRADAGIATPKDLEGKRIGTRAYRTAITVWARGLLEEQHGVDLSRLRWVVWADEVFPIHDRSARLERPADPRKSAVESLLGGEVDAIITDISDARLFEALETSPSVRRLFPNYMGEDLRLYRQTGIFTPVHVIVMSRKLDRQHPDLARRLFDAFEEAKRLAYEDILSDRAGFSVVYLRERLKEQMEQWGDPWKYGIQANRSTIDAFIRYNVSQGMVSSPLSCEDIFAKSTLDT